MSPGSHTTTPSPGGAPPPERPVRSQPPLQAVQRHHPNRFTTSLRRPSSAWCSQRRSAPLLLPLSILATPRRWLLVHRVMAYTQLNAHHYSNLFFDWIMLEISHRLLVFINRDLLWSGHDKDSTDFDPILLGGCSNGLQVTT